MSGVLVIPNFFLQAQLRTQPELWKLPVVLLEEAGTASKDRGKARILQATEAALNAGVDLGMTATQGQARCGELRVLYRSPEDEEAAEASLLDRIDLWTPDFEATAPGVCTLDLLGNGEARRFPDRLGKKMVRLFAEHGLQAQVGFASHPEVALLAARQAAPVLVVGAAGMEEVHFLNQLPVQALVPSREILQIRMQDSEKQIHLFARIRHPKVPLMRRLVFKSQRKADLSGHQMNRRQACRQRF